MSDLFEQAKKEVVATVAQQEPVAEPSTEAAPQVAVEYKGKVWDKEAIVTKFSNADEYIERLKQENEKMQLELQKAATIETLLTKKDNMQETPKPIENTTQVAEVDVEAVAMSAYQKLRQQEKMQENLNAALGQLTANYGDKAVDVLKQKAQEYDLTLDEAKQLAMTKPKLFASQFLDAKQQRVVQPTSGNLNTQTLQQPTKDVKLTALKGKAQIEELNKRFAEKAKQLGMY